MTPRRYAASLALCTALLLGAAAPAGANGSRWDPGPTRAFAAAQFDVGFLYARPRLSLGYGRPYRMWLGIDANPLVSGEGIGVYSGLRFALPYVDLRIGGRYRFTFRRSFLVQRDDYDRTDIESREGPRSRYLSWEAELTTGLPLGPGEIVSELAATYITQVPEGWWVYEETIRAVIDPPWVWRARLGYAMPVSDTLPLKIGAVAELLGVPGRDVLIVRGGLIVRLQLFSALSVRGTFVPVLSSPDSLGLAGGDAFLVGVRYRWASE